MFIFFILFLVGAKRTWADELFIDTISDDASTSSTVRSEGELGIRISLGTYKLFHESGTEWSVVRRRGEEEERMLKFMSL
jgi:hypothetical protein